MKIQCNACEVAEANVLCCADEAALCWACDETVHAANKLASKHQRVPLSSSSSPTPKCDICQTVMINGRAKGRGRLNKTPRKEKGFLGRVLRDDPQKNLEEAAGYFFCLEDRALLCRKCDVAIHTANSYVSNHQRFLLTGVKVGLESLEPGGSSGQGKAIPVARSAETESQSVSRKSTSGSYTGQSNEVLSGQGSGTGSMAASKVSYSGGTTNGSIPEWPLDEFLGLTDFNQGYGYMEHGSSKADSGKSWDSDFSPILQADLDIDECLGQVPEVSWMVPQIPSPPTASGLYWPKSLRSPPSGNIDFVPDICYSPMQDLRRNQSSATILKRRRLY